MGTKIQISPDDTILWPPGKPSPAMGRWRREMRELGFDPDTWAPIGAPDGRGENPRRARSLPALMAIALALAALAAFFS